MSENPSESLDRFLRTTELLSRNKINPKNAFENRMIDLEGSLIIPSNLSNEETSWERSSLIVESHGKVYGYCVDYIYKETIEMLGGVKISESKSGPETIAKRPIRFGTNTLESNESNLNERVVNKIERFDSYFNFIKYKFDCGMTNSLLMNNVATNSALDLVFDENDLLIGNEDTCMSSEVNLEGVVTFSYNEIRQEKFSTLIDKMNGQIEENFESVFDRIENVDNTQEFIENEPESESEKRVGVEEFHDFTGNNFQILDEISDPLFHLESSSVVHRFRDYLTSSLSNPRKKAKLKEEKSNQRAEIFEIQTTIVKIEEDKYDNNMLKVGTVLENFYTPKLTPKKDSFNIERGYKESRLSRLFTRPGSSTKRFSRPRDSNSNNLNDGYEDFNFNPNENIPEPALSLDPNLYLPETFNSVSVGRLELNLKFLKSKIESILQNSPNISFKEVINELCRILPENQSKSLSVHACFIVFLHLANEKELMFNKTGQCDFSVSH